MVSFEVRKREGKRKELVVCPKKKKKGSVVSAIFMLKTVMVKDSGGLKIK